MDAADGRKDARGDNLLGIRNEELGIRNEE